MTHLAFDRMSAIADARDQDVAIGGADGRHLKECAECREQLRALRHVLALAHVLPRDLAPPQEAWDAIRARVSAGPRITKRWGGERWAAAAAAVILLVGAAIVLPFDFGRPNNLKGAKVASIARAPVAVTAVEQHYTETVKELRQALDEQRPALSAGVAG
ncbi:MAG TPA: hypothetical protein VEB19_15980, partial [Gemmatimonadaceae bacterium]|nr:hypothetical protein [Gemmatimonadaceae bacterium]